MYLTFPHESGPYFNNKFIKQVLLNISISLKHAFKFINRLI